MIENGKDFCKEFDELEREWEARFLRDDVGRTLDLRGFPDGFFDEGDL
jgi:hypothetical protein